MNKNEKWIELLAGAKNFKQEDLDNTIIKNWSNTYRDNISAGIMTYRNKLLKEMDTPDFTQPITVESVQKWFLQPINKQDFDFLMVAIKTNYWTIEDLWKGCKNDSVGIMTLVSGLNENVKFYEGMKIYHRGHVVNVLSECDVLEINFIKDSKEFDMSKFLHDVEMDTVPMALIRQSIKIRRDRMANATDFTLTKDNIEYLSAELFPTGLFMALKQAMKINHWTLKELVKEALRQDTNLFMVSGCPNKTLREVTV